MFLIISLTNVRPLIIVRLMEQFALDSGQKVRTYTHKRVIVFLNSAQITKGRERRRTDCIYRKAKKRMRENVGNAKSVTGGANAFCAKRAR